MSEVGPLVHPSLKNVILQPQSGSKNESSSFIKPGGHQRLPGPRAGDASGKSANITPVKINEPNQSFPSKAMKPLSWYIEQEANANGLKTSNTEADKDGSSLPLDPSPSIESP